MLNEPTTSIVMRTLWQIKKLAEPQGNGQNAGPDLQQLVVGSELIIWLDSGDEPASTASLETRVAAALREPGSVTRFGGWSLGESTHLVNDLDAVRLDAPLPSPCRTFLLDPHGTVTLPVWVDHVGSAGTRYAVGSLEHNTVAPDIERLPRIPLPEENK